MSHRIAWGAVMKRFLLFHVYMEARIKRNFKNFKEKKADAGCRSLYISNLS